MSQILTDHEVDGIQEYDNPMPLWLTTLFLATCLYALGYCILYPCFWFWPGTTHWTSTAEAAKREEERMARKAAAPSSKADLAALAKDPKHLANGKSIFEFSCVACHGQHAEGKIGPNLTDKEWKYGGTPADILTSITNGRPGGMPNWGATLKPEEIEDVAAYVLSLSGPKPAGPSEQP